MSRWTGKCDFADSCEMIHDPKSMVEKSAVYLCGAKIDIKDETDLIPYYTYLEAMSCYSKDEGNVIHLSKRSFIDSEEAERLSWKVIQAIKAFRKAKKEKKEFNIEYLKKSKFFWGEDYDLVWLEIVDRIKKDNDITKWHLSSDYREASRFVETWLIPNYFWGIHDPMHNRFREEFVEYARKNGYSTFTDENGKIKREKGKYSPIIMDMCFAINQYRKMEAKWQGVGK